MAISEKALNLMVELMDELGNSQTSSATNALDKRTRDTIIRLNTPESFLDADDIAILVGASDARSTIVRELLKQNDFPTPTKIIGKSRRWVAKDVFQYLKARREAVVNLVGN